MRILITGDYTTKNRGLDAIKNKSAFSDEILNLFKKADFVLINFESPIADSSDEPIKKVGPNLRTTPESICYLQESGVNIVTLANNHFCDYGYNGVSKTIQTLHDYSIDYVGGGLCEQEIKKILYKECNHSTIAFLNYCEEEFSINDRFGSNHINPINVYYDIQEAKRNSDYIIIITHGGHEGYQLPSPRMKVLYRYFIDLGANVVVNHHQHCYSGYEKYHNGYIYYGLGNFFFDRGASTKSIDSLWNEGYILDIKLKDGILDTDIIPYKQCKNNIIQVELMSNEELVIFNKNIRRLNSIIVDDNLLKESFDSYVNKQYENYKIIFSPYSNRYLRGLCKKGLLPSFINEKQLLHILNTIRCESHRDLAIESIKKSIK